MTFRTRRRFLAAASGVGVAATAGCLSGGDDGDDESSDDEPPEDPSTGSDNSTDEGDETPSVTGTVLGDITIDNLHDADHAVDVQVEINGETQAWVSKDVEARNGSVALDQSWDTGGGNFRVRVRLDGTEFVEVTPEDWNDPDCISLIVVIDGSGNLRVAGDTTGGYCAE